MIQNEGKEFMEELGCLESLTCSTKFNPYDMGYVNEFYTRPDSYGHEPCQCGTK